MIFIKPKILLSAKGNEGNYINAVNLSGGEAILYPTNTECDGLLLCGGGDIDPSFYNEKNELSRNIDIDRDIREFELLKRFIEAKKPVLGICRGLQIINVFFGGTLYQHVNEHRNIDGSDRLHNITLDNQCFTINSCHHQAVKTLGNELLVTAVSDDGIIEGIKHKSLQITGVQWHPERLHIADNGYGDEIFRHFVKSCAKSK